MLLVAGLAMDLDLSAFAITLLAPATPFVAWAIRERFRQIDAASAIEMIKAEAEDMWAREAGGQADEPACAASYRRFQNAIYARRVANPLLLPLMCRLMREEKEIEMSVGAAALLRQAGIDV